MYCRHVYVSRLSYWRLSDLTIVCASNYFPYWIIMGISTSFHAAAVDPHHALYIKTSDTHTVVNSTNLATPTAHSHV